VSFSASPGPGDLCQRYEEVVNDTGVPSHEGKVFVTTYHGVMCLIPKSDSRFLLDRKWSERLPPGSSPAPRQEVEEALKSWLEGPVVPLR
jgi:hypothetical protein